MDRAERERTYQRNEGKRQINEGQREVAEGQRKVAEANDRRRGERGREVAEVGREGAEGARRHNELERQAQFALPGWVPQSRKATLLVVLLAGLAGGIGSRVAELLP